MHRCCTLVDDCSRGRIRNRPIGLGLICLPVFLLQLDPLTHALVDVTLHSGGSNIRHLKQQLPAGQRFEKRVLLQELIHLHDFAADLAGVREQLIRTQRAWLRRLQDRRLALLTIQGRIVQAPFDPCLETRLSRPLAAPRHCCRIRWLFRRSN
jgi:hypothetical protein